MRHRVYGKHLSRDKNERSALFKSLIGALFIHGSIETTESKAKAVKGLIDKIITQAKSKDTQRLISAYLINKQLQEKLIKEIAPALKDRVSGYTSVVRLGSRYGDGAMVVRMSLMGNISKGLPDKKESRVKRMSPTSSEQESSKETAAPSLRGGSKTRRGNLPKKPATRKVAKK